MFFKKEDFIFQHNAELDSTICERIIEIFEDNQNEHHSGVIGADRKVIPSMKDCTQMDLSFSQHNLITDQTSRILRRSINKFVEKYQLGDHGFRISDEFNMQRYNPGQAYHKLHCENSGGSYPLRFLAWMIYLNDVKDGGQTYFPNQNRKLKPRQGDVYLWPAIFTHRHQGLVSKTQTKYILTGWCEFTSPYK